MNHDTIYTNIVQNEDGCIVPVLDLAGLAYMDMMAI